MSIKTALRRGFYSVKWKIRDRIINEKNVKRLNNKDFTLISRDCLGGIVLHDMHLRFNTPTINLWFSPSDFVKFCKGLKYYSSLELEFIKEDKIDYPVARLGDIKVYFTHYTEAEAKQKWKERCKRINYDNLFFLMTDTRDCSEEDMREFDKLVYQHIIFTYNKYSKIPCTYYCDSHKLGFSMGI